MHENEQKSEIVDDIGIFVSLATTSCSASINFH